MVNTKANPPFEHFSGPRPLIKHYWLNRILSERWKTYNRAMSRCRKSFSPEDVHDLRVATRRLIVVYDILKTVTGSERPLKPRPRLKKLVKQYGPLRDVQVQKAQVQDLLTSFPQTVEFYDWLDRLEKDLVKQVKKRWKKLKPVKPKKHPAANLGLDCLSATEQRLNEIRYKLCEAFAEIIKKRQAVIPGNISSVHSFRLAFKKFRYLAEALQPINSLSQEEKEALGSLQGMLGRVQDLQVLLLGIDSFLISHQELSSSFIPVLEDLRSKQLKQVDEALAAADQVIDHWRYYHGFLR